MTSRQSWRDVLKVHPAADLFPMMTPDELKALGEDISKNGLQQPITTLEKNNGDPLLVDGRNRREAMERIGVRFELSQRKNGRWRLELDFPEDDDNEDNIRYGLFDPVPHG
jgi:hypothetical protein